MKDKILSFVEIDILQRNLKAIENELGYPAPQHLLNSDDLSKKILSLQELDTIVRNIRSIDAIRNQKYSNGRGKYSAIDCWPIFLFLFMVVVIIIAEIKGMLFGY